jgi:hypothetical protein
MSGKSPIVGTYTNAAFNAKLVITKADDATGSISGTFSTGSQSWNIQGTWNTSTMAPSAGFYFSGSNVNPTVMIAGTGASTNFQTFEHTTISVSMAQAGGIVTSFQGAFVRS